LTATSTAASPDVIPSSYQTAAKKQLDSPLDENEFTKVQVKVGKDEFSRSIGKGGFLDRIDPQK
jgi:hypothetical protein